MTIYDHLIDPPTLTGAPQPNVLLLFSDQHHWRYAGFNGHPVVRTPNLDRLAARGVNFTNAYCNSPLCSPSRQSFLSGLFPCHAGLWNNCCGMPENAVTWPHALRHAGYETILCGKMHFNGYQRMYGFDRRPVLEMNTDGELFHSYGLRTSHDWTKPLPYRTGKRCEVPRAGPRPEPRAPVLRHDAAIVQGTIDVLREKAADRSGRPWALCCSTILPHPPYEARPDLFASYEGLVGDPVNPCGEHLGVVDSAMRHFHWMDAGQHTPADIRRMRQAYFAMITEFDEYVGRILDTLASTGLAANTVVLYFSDHGDMIGEHGMYAKCSLREASARIPLLVSAPGRFPQGARVDTPVSLVDLYPTLLDLAGYRLPPILDLDGHSLLPLLDNRPAAFAGQGVFCEFEGEGWNHPRCFLREGDWKFVYNHTVAHELYDLRNDPEELQNLADVPAHAATARRLRDRILSFWNPEAIEREVLRTQARQKIACCRNVCKDLGW